MNCFALLCALQVSRNYYSGSSGSGETATSRGALQAQTTGIGSGIDHAPPALVFSLSAADDGVRSSAVACTHATAVPAPFGVRADLPLLVLAGDAFTESNFDGCLRSARYAVQALAAAVGPN